MEHRIVSNYIVITSIFQPSEAVLAFSKMKNYQLIVVGDKKTPSAWKCDNVQYISVAQQDDLGYSLSRLLPYNHYCRKMIGYLQAINQGADYIIDTDDDNVPKENWSFPSFEDKYDCIPENIGFVNIYQLFTAQKIWPRGLPLRLINEPGIMESDLILQDCNVGVWQALADEDPDVDAIYRLTNDTPCYFNERKPVVLKEGTICPFNTQNTILKKELFTDRKSVV